MEDAPPLADRGARQQDLLKNVDGSVNLYFCPTAPKALKKNWIPTVPGQAWFAWLRLYAPQRSLLRQTMRS